MVARQETIQTAESAKKALAPTSLFHYILLSLLVLALALFFWRLGDRDLWSSHEARAAMNARSLLEAGDGLPRLTDGRIETQKPPLYYWLVAGVGRLRGAVDGVAARLPSTLSALGVVILVFAVPAWLGRPQVGLIAALILATGVHFPWLARIGRIDIPLTFTVSLASLAFYSQTRTKSRLVLLVGWLACAAGILLKGPIGVVLPAAIVAGWLLLEGRWPAFWEWGAWRSVLAELGVWWGVVLMLVICVPVFIWLDFGSDGTFLRDFFWHHNVQRGLGGSRLRGHPWWLYLPYLLLYLLPYSPLLLAACWRRLWRDDPLARFGLAWMIGVVILLSAARFKRADYLLPAYPGAAIFLGCVVARNRWLVRSLVGVAAIMLIGWFVRIEYQLPDEESYRDYRPFAAVIREREQGEVVFFRGEAHALAFRVGKPLTVLVEWHHLRERIQSGAQHIVMSPATAAEMQAHLPGMTTEEIASTTALAGGRHERPLVLLRITPGDMASAKANGRRE